MWTIGYLNTSRKWSVFTHLIMHTKALGVGSVLVEKVEVGGVTHRVKSMWLPLCLTCRKALVGHFSFALNRLGKHSICIVGDHFQVVKAVCICNLVSSYSLQKNNKNNYPQVERNKYTVIKE